MAFSTQDCSARWQTEQQLLLFHLLSVGVHTSQFNIQQLIPGLYSTFKEGVPNIFWSKLLQCLATERHTFPNAHISVQNTGAEYVTCWCECTASEKITPTLAALLSTCNSTPAKNMGF